MLRDSKPGPTFNVSKETRDRMIGLIKKYFLEERDIDFGDLAATLVLDFFMDNLAIDFYNQGVYDSHKYMLERAEDMMNLQKVSRC